METRSCSVRNVGFVQLSRQEKQFKDVGLGVCDSLAGGTLSLFTDILWSKRLILEIISTFLKMKVNRYLQPYLDYVDFQHLFYHLLCIIHSTRIIVRLE